MSTGNGVFSHFVGLNSETGVVILPVTKKPQDNNSISIIINWPLTPYSLCMDLSIFHLVSDLILTIILKGRYYYYLHF